MTSRERLHAALLHQEPDRVPYDQSSRSSSIEFEAYEALKRSLGIQTPTSCFVRAHAHMEEPVARLLGVDTRFVHAMQDWQWSHGIDGDVFIDAWHAVWRRRPGHLYFELDGNPFASMEYDEILGMRWDPLIDAEQAAALASQAKEYHYDTTAAVLCDQLGAGVFERAWYQRGFEQFLVDLMLEPSDVGRYLDKITDHLIEGYRMVLDAVGPYVDAVLITDDIATQDGLMCSKEVYRALVKPRQKRLLAYIKSRGFQVVFHSCGAVAPLIPDLLDIGVEILHPIQRSASGMDALALKREFGKDLVLWGAGCDTALLQHGSVRDIIDDVRRTMDALAPGGGFVFTTTHCIQPGTPPENILAMAGAVQGMDQPEGHETAWVESFTMGEPTCGR